MCVYRVRYETVTFQLSLYRPQGSLSLLGPIVLTQIEGGWLYKMYEGDITTSVLMIEVWILIVRFYFKCRVYGTERESVCVYGYFDRWMK